MTGRGSRPQSKERASPGPFRNNATRSAGLLGCGFFEANKVYKLCWTNDIDGFWTRGDGAMKKIILFGAMILALAPSNALAAKLRLNLQPQDSQTTRVDQGLRAVDDNMPQSSVRVFETEEPASKRGVLMLYVLNAGEAAHDLGIENVSMETEDGTPIQMISYDQLLKEEKNREKWAMVGAALSGMAGAINAAYAGNTYGTVNTYGSAGWSRSTVSLYNPAAANLAAQANNIEMQRNFDRIGETSAANMEALRVNLRTTTVDPDQSFGGQIMYELPKSLRSGKTAVPVLIHVSFGSEVHTFKAVLTKGK